MTLQYLKLMSAGCNLWSCFLSKKGFGVLVTLITSPHSSTRHCLTVGIGILGSHKAPSVWYQFIIIEREASKLFLTQHLTRVNHGAYCTAEKPFTEQGP